MMSNSVTIADMEQQIKEMHENVNLIGETKVLTHLESARGRAMNGRRCIIVGKDTLDNGIVGIRTHVRLLNPTSMKPEGNPIRVQSSNLARPEQYSTKVSQSSISDNELLQRLTSAMKKATAKGHHREANAEMLQDSYYRYHFLQQSLPAAVPPTSRCMDSMVPKAQQHYRQILRLQTCPPCIGNGLVDFRKFSEGLIGNGEHCVICCYSIDAQARPISLPCGHIFHVACASPWLSEHDTCPTCRQTPINPWTSYLRDADAMIQHRFDEWFVNGMCERCQMVYYESDPVTPVKITVIDNGGESMTEAFNGRIPISLLRRLESGSDD